jgi:hypothetical protein
VAMSMRVGLARESNGPCSCRWCSSWTCRYSCSMVWCWCSCASARCRYRPSANDHHTIWDRLDKVHAKHPDMVLLHGGSPKGAERIAAAWANNRKVRQIAFKPDWAPRQGGARELPFQDAGGCRAIFKRPRGRRGRQYRYRMHAGKLALARRRSIPPSTRVTPPLYWLITGAKQEVGPTLSASTTATRRRSPRLTVVTSRTRCNQIRR